MAWNEKILCSLCGCELPVLRKVSKSQFCSQAHEETFLAQQNLMAVEVLHRTHDALKAYRPAGSSIEDILGASAARRSQSAVEPLSAEVKVPMPVALQESVAPQTRPSLENSRPATPAKREFDVAAPAVLSNLAGQSPGTPEPSREWLLAASDVHFGESLSQMPETGVIAWFKRLFASVWR